MNNPHEKSAKRRAIRRRVWYLVPVDFVAYSTECLDYLEKNYIQDPCHEACGCHVDYGSYWIKRRKLRKAP